MIDKSRFVLLAPICALACWGCVAADPVAEGAEPELGSASQALGSAFKEYWIGYDSAVTFNNWSRDSQFCVLSGVRGKDPTVRTVRGSSDWRGSSGEDSAGWALCFPKSNFSGPSGSIFMTSSDSDCWEDDFAYTSKDCWWGDAATAVIGVSGDFNGGGEYTRIDQSTLATSPSRITAHASASYGVTGYGRSIFFGVGGKQPVRLMGYDPSGNVVRGQFSSPGTFTMSASTYSGYSSYWLTPVENGACYFSKIGGEFNGGGEIGRITQVDGWWYEQAIAGSGDVWVSARCMAWDQR